mmetsp:Transcript_21897/g.70757  ORF Transcript_21897/g.70757 Transcript_21897/m.70757 type:complete len:238 (-) Transcript_21897:58-771(-)
MPRQMESDPGPPKRVALYGLSANPPTGDAGHAGIVARLASEGFDEVWVIPVYRHIYESKRKGLEDFEHRLAMCELCFCGPRTQSNGTAVKVLALERELAMEALARDGEGARVGSIDLLRHLRSRFPTDAFTWVMGSDTYRDLRAGLWKEGDVFLATVPLVVVPRVLASGEPAEEVEVAPGSDVRLLCVNGLGDVSSSAVREALRDPERRAAAAVPGLTREVLEYIREHRLFAEDARM